MANGLGPYPLVRQSGIYMPNNLVYRYNPFSEDGYYDTIPMVDFIVECEANRERWEQLNGGEMPRVDPANLDLFEMERLLRYTGSNWLPSSWGEPTEVRSEEPQNVAVTATPPRPIRRQEEPPRAPERLGRRIRREVAREVVREINFDVGGYLLDFEGSNDAVCIGSPPSIRRDDMYPRGGSPIVHE